MNIDFQQVINDVQEDMGKHSNKVLRATIKQLLIESVQDRAKLLQLKDRVMIASVELCNIACKTTI